MELRHSFSPKIIQMKNLCTDRAKNVCGYLEPSQGIDAIQIHCAFNFS